jgi:hypothetical protein
VNKNFTRFGHSTPNIRILGEKAGEAHEFKEEKPYARKMPAHLIIGDSDGRIGSPSTGFNSSRFSDGSCRSPGSQRKKSKTLDEMSENTGAVSI